MPEIAVPPAGRPPGGAAAPEASDQLLRRLEWQVMRRLDGLLQGDYRTLWRGAGIDLPTCVNTSTMTTCATSIGTSPHACKRPTCASFWKNRDLTAWFVLDVSGSVDFGSGDTTKLAVATGLVATLARVLTRTATAWARCCMATPWNT